MKYLAVILLLAACKSDGKKSGRQPEPAPVGSASAADPACANKAKDLEPFLAALLVEEASNEINMGWSPVVVGLEARPVRQDIDNVTITPKTVSAYDVSEANHVDNNIQPNTGADVALARFAKILEMKVEKRRGADDMLRLDIDKDATWGEVTRIVDAATAAGYKQAVFAFEATSKLAPPPGVDAQTTDAEVTAKSEARLGELKKQCAPLGDVVFNLPKTDNKIDEQKAIAKVTADAIVKCNCAVDVDEFRALTWKTKRWHQAHARVPVELELGAGTTIELPAATPWSEAHAKITDAKGAVKLVAK